MKRSIWYPVMFTVLTLVAVSGLSDGSARSWIGDAAAAARTAMTGPGAVALRRSALRAASSPVAAAAFGVGFLALAALVVWFGMRRPAATRDRGGLVRRLARRGSTISHIARETRLSQDAVRLLLPAEEPAGPARGSFFRLAPRRVRAAWKALRTAQA